MEQRIRDVCRRVCLQASVRFDVRVLRRWLTELSARKNTEEKTAEPQPQGDEDGPPSSDGGDEEKAHTEDEDESMSDSSGGSQAPELAPTPLPRIREYDGYFELQREASILDATVMCVALLWRSERAFASISKARCGIHALSNCVGREFVTDADLEFALDDYIENSQRESLFETRGANAKANGWYSIEVLAHAINTTSMRKANRIEYTLELKSLYLQPEIIHTCVGAIVNLRSEHWVALRSIAGQIWFLDSLERSPRKLSREGYIAYVNKHKAAYPIIFAERIGFASTSKSSLDDSLGGSPVLPVLGSQDTAMDDSLVTTVEDEPMHDAAASSTRQQVQSGPPVGDTSVPALMVAECHGPALSHYPMRAE